MEATLVGSRIFAGSGRVGLPSAAAGGFGRGCRLDRHGAARIVRRVARRAGITKAVGPHTLRHAFITAALGPASRCATCRKPPRTPTRGPPCAMTAPGRRWTATPRTSSPPTLQAPPDKSARMPPPGRRTPTGRRPRRRSPGAIATGHSRTADLSAVGNATQTRRWCTDESNLRVRVHRGSQSSRVSRERSPDYESRPLLHLYVAPDLA
jgi:hypothetical protein